MKIELSCERAMQYKRGNRPSHGFKSHLDEWVSA